MARAALFHAAGTAIVAVLCYATAVRLPWLREAYWAPIAAIVVLYPDRVETVKAGGFLDTGVDLKNPDFAAIARAAGMQGIRVERSSELEGALREALASPGPALVDVTTAKQELVMPPKIQLEQAKGFSLFMLKAILNGRGDELVELADTNILR